jgi:hypothetical protein
VAAFDGVVEGNVAVGRKVQHVAGATNAYRCGGGFHLEPVLVQAGDRTGERAQRPFDQRKNTDAGFVRLADELVLLDPQFRIGPNSDERTIAHAQLRHAVSAADH